MKRYVGVGINNGIIVSEEDAWKYIFDDLMKPENHDLRMEFVNEVFNMDKVTEDSIIEWYFSGSWITEEVNEE